MKHIYIIFLTLLIISCQKNKEKSLEITSDDTLETLHKKREVVEKKIQKITKQLKQLDTRISELDTLKKIPLITTFLVKEEIFNHYLNLQGSVQTKQNIVIYPEMAGTLLHVYVKEGQHVAKGQLLASIDDGGLEQQVAQLQIKAALAKTAFNRQERLWKQKIGSEMQYLQAKSTFEAQQTAVNQLKRQLAKTTIRAPFSGVIDDVITEQGTVVSPGQSPIMRIVNLRNMYVETEVPESYITNITKGKNVEVEFPVLGKTITAKIRQAGNFINPANRTFKVEIGIPNKEQHIKPNLTAKLKINDYTNKKAILIPQSIISENAKGEQYVYLITNKNGKENIAKRVIIKTGKTQEDIIEVLEGIKKNDQIIEEGARTVTNGQEVKIINK